MKMSSARAAELLNMFTAFTGVIDGAEYLFDESKVIEVATVDPAVPPHDRRALLINMLVVQAVAHRVVLEGGFTIEEMQEAAADASRRCGDKLPALPASISPAAEPGSREDQIMHYLMNTGGCSRHNECLSTVAAGQIGYLLRENELLRARMGGCMKIEEYLMEGKSLRDLRDRLMVSSDGAPWCEHTARLLECEEHHGPKAGSHPVTGTAECPFKPGIPVQTIQRSDGSWHFAQHTIEELDEKPCACKGLHAPGPTKA